MKKLFYFFAVMMLFSMTACTKEEPVDPVEPTPVEITVSKESILVNKGGTSKAISVDGSYTYKSGSLNCAVDAAN